MKKATLFLLILLLGVPVFAVPYPVIFVHGIGDSSVIWKKVGPAVSMRIEKYYKTTSHPYFLAGSGIGRDGNDLDFSDNLRNSCVYVTFSDHFASPRDQVKELEKVITETREEAYRYFPKYFPAREKVKVNLVSFSMGGLVARDYLCRHPKDHHVAKCIMVSVPHGGSRWLIFEDVPYWMGISGIFALGFGNPLGIGIGLAAIGIDYGAYLRGTKLGSPATWDIKEGSKYLGKLNSHPMPEDVEYYDIVSDSSAPINWTLNKLVLAEGGDGAIPLKNQKLAEAGVPNFSRLKYKQYKIDSPHFENPHHSIEEVISALGL